MGTGSTRDNVASAGIHDCPIDASGVYLQTSPPNEQSDENVYDVTVSADDEDLGHLTLESAGRHENGRRKLRIDSYSVTRGRNHLVSTNG